MTFRKERMNIKNDEQFAKTNKKVSPDGEFLPFDGETMIRLIRSRRKTVSVEVRKDLSVIVRAPLRMNRQEIDRFVKEKSEWIQKHLLVMQQRKSAEREVPPKLTESEIRRLTETARVLLTERVAYFAPQVGVTYARITVRHQRSRWGSCSQKGNLNFNCLLALCPPEVADYVVVHELCHRPHMNHSAAFWREVERVLPSYREPRKWLKNNGSALIERLP